MGWGGADLDYRVGGKLATVVDMQVRLIEGFDGNSLGILPCHHLEHHLMPPYMCQLLHRVSGLYSDLQPYPFILRKEKEGRTGCGPEQDGLGPDSDNWGLSSD